VSIPDEGYSRNTSSSLSVTSTVYFCKCGAYTGETEFTKVTYVWIRRTIIVINNYMILDLLFSVIIINHVCAETMTTGWMIPSGIWVVTNIAVLVPVGMTGRRTSQWRQRLWRYVENLTTENKVNVNQCFIFYFPQNNSWQLNLISTVLLLRLMWYIYWWTPSTRWYHPPSSHCFSLIPPIPTKWTITCSHLQK
jgi:hypothetical protein